MTHAQHTPGPWIIDSLTSGNATQIYGDKRHIAVALTQTSEKFPVTVETAQANACLIAAAPELLEALKQALNAFHAGNNDAALIYITTKGAAAIAKARGES